MDPDEYRKFFADRGLTVEVKTRTEPRRITNGWNKDGTRRFAMLPAGGVSLSIKSEGEAD